MRSRVRNRIPSATRDLLAAASAAALVALATWFAFSKGLPFQNHFEVRAVFESANNLKPGSPVRISGIDVGKVEAIDPGAGNTSLVTMRIDERGRPIRRDATFAIIPRLILQGNDYVKVTAGTPDAPPVRDGDTIGRSQTSYPVQLDQVLNVLNRPTRYALQSAIRELAGGLGRASRSGSKSARPGFAGLRRAARELDAALLSVTQVAHAAQGTKPGDLRRAVRSTGDVTAQLARDPQELAGLVTSYNRVTEALADNSQAFRATIRQFDRVMRVAPGALTALDAALPKLTRSADDLRPALHAAPAALGEANRLLTQLGRLVSERELPRLLTGLAPVTETLPGLQRQLHTLLPLVTSVMRCVSRNIVPTLNMKLQDGPNTTGQPVWQDAIHGIANFAGASPNFDGNGTTLRLGVSEGEQALTGFIPGIGEVAGIGPEIAGINPVWLGYGANPRARPDMPCVDQPLPDLSARRGGPPRTSLRATPLRRPSASDLRILQGLVGSKADRQRLIKRLLRNSRRAAATPGAPSKRRVPKPLRGAPSPRLGPKLLRGAPSPGLVPKPLREAPSPRLVPKLLKGRSSTKAG